MDALQGNMAPKDWFWFFGRHDVYWDFHLWTNYYLYQYDNGAMIDDYGYEPFSQYQYGFGFYYPVVRK